RGRERGRELPALPDAGRDAVPQPLRRAARRGRRTDHLLARRRGRLSRLSPGVGVRRPTARDSADGFSLGRFAETAAGGASACPPASRTERLAWLVEARPGKPTGRLSGGGPPSRVRCERAGLDGGGALPCWLSQA